MKNGDIAYKVVFIKDRRSCSFRFDSITSIYCIFYEKGNIVESLRGTLGIFIFETEEQARMFIEIWDIWKDSLMILQVKILGEPKKPDKIPSPSRVENYYRNPSTTDMLWITAPFGTYCVPAVEVLT